jgi:hypothetical protein
MVEASALRLQKGARRMRDSDAFDAQLEELPQIHSVVCIAHELQLLGSPLSLLVASSLALIRELRWRFRGNRII